MFHHASGSRWLPLADLGSVVVRSVPVESETVVTALDSLNLLRDKVDHLHQQIDRLFIAPRLETQQGRIPTISAEGEMLRVVDYDNNLSAEQLFFDLRAIVEFLNAHLPSGLMSNLSGILIPNLTNRLISTRLSSSVPSTLDDLPAFEELLRETKRFEDVVHKREWTRERELSDWVERAPKVWLAKRRETSVDTARKILARGIGGAVETVERSETQTVPAEYGREMASGVAQVAGAGEWNAAWNDDEGQERKTNNGATREPEQPGEKPHQEFTKNESPPATAGFLDDDDDEAANGWGLDEDLGLDDQDEQRREPEPEPAPAPTVPAPAPAPAPEPQEEAGDDDDMDWGAWGDEDEMSTGAPSSTAQHARRPSVSNAASVPTNRSTKSKNITLTETYTITSIPRALLDVISQLLSEAAQLQTNPQYASSPVASAAAGIFLIPTLVLAVFRALAPLYYSEDLKASMYIYNDSTFLSSHLPKEIGGKDGAQVMAFGKRQYSKAVEEQRTLLCDYLDGAQGFAACTDAQQRQECDSAIASTTYRLREVHTAWKSVLSKSVLCQSVGSLLNTVVTKLVNDIEHLGDISEPESVRLAKYCSDIVALEGELFGTIGPVEVYCANWVRFRYVGRILESSMVQIMAMVRDGVMLRLLMKEEVVDLVKALFAESEMRRSCIGDIWTEEV